jgi:hypothetical protein
LPSSPPEDDGLAECSHDGAGFGAAGVGVAQLGSGAGVGSAADLGAAGLATRTACFFAGLFLALAFLADFFGAAAFAFFADFFADFLADFLADFFADFLAFFADFFEDFFADFFFAVRTFLFFLAFLPFLFFLPLAIVILLLPPINVYRAFQVVRRKGGAN